MITFLVTPVIRYITLSSVFLLSLLAISAAAIADEQPATNDQEISQLVKQADQQIKLGQYQQGLELLLNAYKLSHAIDDAKINSDILSAMAHAYYNTGQLEQAHRYYQELVALDEASGDKASLSVTLFNLGHVNASNKNYQLAQQNFQRSLELSQQLADKSGVAYTLKAMGVNAQAQSNFKSAKDYLERSLATFEAIQDIQQAARIHRHLADIAQQLHQYKLAITHYKIALSDLNNEPQSKALIRTHRGLSNAYASLANYQQALHHHRRYTDLIQKELQRQSEQTTRRLQVQFETEHFAIENERLALLNQNQQAELEHRQSILHMTYLAIALAASIIFLILMLWSRSKHHAYQMQLLASTDDLTGVRNRRAITQAGQEEWQRCIRFKRSLSCLLLDIDHFKSINDNYGHTVGDDVLKDFASLVEETLRKADLFGRFGGEEFLIIASETNIAQAFILAERIKQKLTSLNHEAIKDRKITVSIGIAEISDEGSLDELIAHADIALYAAKEQGRNRAISYQG